MSQLTARWEDRSDTASHDDVEAPTRRVPVFVLAEENARVERQLAEAAHTHEDATVTIGAEENRRLLASVFDDARASFNTDDEPTLDAPAPIVPADIPSPAPLELRPLPLPLRSPPIPALVLTSPAPVSGVRRRELPAPPKPAAKKNDEQRWIVAGIWAMAVGLVAFLMFIASSA